MRICSQCLFAQQYTTDCNKVNFKLKAALPEPSRRCDLTLFTTAFAETGQ